MKNSITERKLNIGARMVQGGGVQKVFTQIFGVQEEEKLLKVSPCYLSTTTGIVAGLLFISTKKIAFCCERSLRLISPSREAYINVKKPTQRYIKIATLDSFNFWFMGFVNYQKTFKYVQHAISQFSLLS
ncbi:hypothetical protein ACHQM5_004973 [Ranunculus cassubicifolius]